MLDRLMQHAPTRRLVYVGRQIRWLCIVLGDRLFDGLLGLDTAGQVSYQQLGFDAHAGTASAVRSLYVPARWTCLAEGLRGWNVSEHDSFIDFGCGKGRVVYLAARFPFGTISGVDLSASVIAVAKTNVDRKQSTLACQTITLMVADAVDYPIPDQMTVAFFANPFQGAVFEQVMANIRRSLERCPREIRIIYLRPVMHECVLRHGFQEIHHNQPWRLLGVPALSVYGNAARTPSA